MARTLAEHGTRQRYNQGCADGIEGNTCDACKKANNDYKRNLRQQKNAAKNGGTVTTLKTVPNTPEKPQIVGIGPMEAALLRMVADLPTAEVRPDLVEGARAMCRIIDNPTYAAQQTQALKQYREAIAELRKGAERKGRLSAVRAMTAAG